MWSTYRNVVCACDETDRHPGAPPARGGFSLAISCILAVSLVNLGADSGSVTNAGRFSAARMASAVWSHGPEMAEEMQNTGLKWPTLSARDMTDLIAFLNDGR